MKPSTKVTAATLASAVTAIVVWQLEMHVWEDIPGAAQGGLVVILTLLAGYLVPEKNPSNSAREVIASERAAERARGG